jgi:hypothetical protein
LYPEAEAIGGEAEDLVKDGEEEHHVVDVLMEEISALSPNDEAFVAEDDGADRERRAPCRAPCGGRRDRTASQAARNLR